MGDDADEVAFGHGRMATTAVPALLRSWHDRATAHIFTVRCLAEDRWLLVAPDSEHVLGRIFDRRVLRPRDNWDSITRVEKPDRDCRVQVKA